MTGLSMLDEELADTLTLARRGRPQKAASRDLARQVVGAPRPPRGGTCLWCGAPAPGDIACAGHTDLPYLDPVFAEVVTENTTAASSQSSGRARELAAEGV